MSVSLASQMFFDQFDYDMAEVSIWSSTGMATTSALTTRCLNCQQYLTSGGPQCEKCRKNEEKYGPPESCMYCSLPAAFNEKKCVHCHHSERRSGPPVPCANCKIKSAFTPSSSKKTLCRLCEMSARHQGLAEMAGVSLLGGKDRRDPRHTSSSRKLKPVKRKPSEQKSVIPTKQANLEPPRAVNSQSLVEMQQLQEKVESLQRTVKERDADIQSKNSTIANLKAEIAAGERKFRETFAQLAKEKEQAIELIHQKYRDQARQERQEKAEKEKQAQIEKERRAKEKKARKEKEQKEAEEKAKKEKEAAEKAAKEKENSAPAVVKKEKTPEEESSKIKEEPKKEEEDEEHDEEKETKKEVEKDEDDEEEEDEKKPEKQSDSPKPGSKKAESHDEADDSD